LLMELVTDVDGNAAPRLNDLTFTAEDARKHHHTLIKEVIRMLCAGIVHGDLSEFNILLSSDGPVIIDLPQAVDAAGNNHAMSMLERDVNNLSTFFGQFAPELLKTQYGKEIWALYARGALSLEVELTGQVKENRKPVDLKSVIRVIDAVRDEETARQTRMAEAASKNLPPKNNR
jgi:RIO kinase 1